MEHPTRAQILNPLHASVTKFGNHKHRVPVLRQRKSE